MTELTVVEYLRAARRQYEFRKGQIYDEYSAMCAVIPDDMCDWLCDLLGQMDGDFDKAIARAKLPPYTMPKPPGTVL